MKKYVVDTSAVIEKAVSILYEREKLRGEIIIPHAVVAELENQANRGFEIGFVGLEELQQIRKLNGITIMFKGERPNETQIRLAKSGEIDALIREIANKEKAVLITCDKVQAESGKAFGLEVKHVKFNIPKEKLAIEKYFDDKTMSVHIKENTHPKAKKGGPGNWELVVLENKILSADDIEDMAKEVVEKARIDPATFIEIARRGSTIVQYKDIRIVIVKPPVADGWEITAVKPLIKLKLEDYDLNQELANRIKEKARGIIVAGEVGSGKSTFCQAVAEYYNNIKKVVKTIESPRDLQLDDNITQYSKNFTSSEEIHDILFLSRPDNIIFDEMRDTPDFKLYTDLRLAGSNVLGVLHASSAIDAVQRFIGRLETGMIPSVLDTILFIEKGNVDKVYTLRIIVKVPSGMMEEDLARPVVEIRNFINDKLEYEIYSYGEETVIIPVEKENINGARQLAAKAIENELRKYSKDVIVEVIGNNKAIVYVPEHEIGRIIGKDGVVIDKIERDLGISIEVKELKIEKGSINYRLHEDKNHLVFFINEHGKKVDFYIDDDFLFSATSGKKGDIRVNKKSNLGRILLKAMDKRENITLRK